MTDPRHEQVRDAVRYLQRIRPIDPEEVCRYVETQPHPAVVREDIRRLAVDLGLHERTDGTFVPVESEPMSIEYDEVTALPDIHARRLEDILVETYGSDWPKGATGEELRRTIRELKSAYLAQDAVSYDRETALGYALYHLPATYAAAHYVIGELIEAKLVPRNLRVLDVGAGVGGPALGIHDLLFEDSAADTIVGYDAVEPSAAAEVFEALLTETDPNFHPTVHRDTAQDHDPQRTYDLILFANVLSELADPVEILQQYLGHLASTGSLVAIAPADRNTATGLRQIEREVTSRGSVTVYAPTVRLWQGYEPTDRGWTFDRKPELDVPAFQRHLDEMATDPAHTAGEFLNTDVQFAYAILRTDGRRAIELTPDPASAAKMAEMDQHVTERIDCFAVKLSPDISDDGNPLFKVGDGSQQVDHYAVLVEETSLNAALHEAEYGDLLHLERTLVLWNADEEAYNLVVDEECVVQRLPQ